MTVPAPAAPLTDADRTLAAEYVLGTLDSDERQAVRARIAADAPFAGLVRLWERRLSPLHELAVPVTPPPSIWRVIVADLKAAPPATPVKAPRKVPAPAEPAPRPVVGETRPGRAPAPRGRGAMATVRRLFGLGRPGRGAGEGPARPKRPAAVPPPVVPPVPAALRVPGGRTLGGAIQDAVAAGLLPPAPPLPEPPRAPASERTDPLPPPLKLAPPAPPRPRPVPEPLTPPPAFMFLEPEPPPAAESPDPVAGVDQAEPAPAPADEGTPVLLGPPPVFTFLEPDAPPVVAAPESGAGADQAAPVAPAGEVTPPPAPSGDPVPAASGVPETGAMTAPLPEPVDKVAAPHAPASEAFPLVQTPAPDTPVVPAESHPPGPVEHSSAALPEGQPPHAGAEAVAAPAATTDAGTPAEPLLLQASEAARPETTTVPTPDAVVPESPAAGEQTLPAEAPTGPSAVESTPQQSATGKAAPVEPAPVEPAAEPPSADPAAGAKGEEAPPLPGWAAVVASGVVSALPDPAATGDEPAPGHAAYRTARGRSLPWRTVALTLAVLLVAVAAFAAYREWFWPRDGQWVGVLQSEPLPSIAVRLDPDSGVIFVRSFAPAPPEGEINRLWLLVPGRSAVLLGEFSAGLSDRAPALAGLGRSRLGAAEVVVTQESKLGSGAASADGQPPGRVVYRGRLAPE